VFWARPVERRRLKRRVKRDLKGSKGVDLKYSSEKSGKRNVRGGGKGHKD
jgi:hypothetical protein